MLTRVVFAVLIPPMLALIGVLVAVTLALVLFARHPALALLPLGALGLGIFLFARWEQGRFRPPDG